MIRFRVMQRASMAVFLGEPLSSEEEHLERMHGLLGAHRSLLLIAPEPGRYTELLRQPDPAFEGASAGHLRPA